MASKDVAAEGRLIARLQAGDDAAFDEVVRGYGPQLLSVIHRYLPDDSDAHDALQETFLSVFRAIGNFQSGSSLGTWLHRIAVNAALMKLRRRRRKPEQSLDEMLPKFALDGHRTESRGSWSNVPDEAALGRETRDLVRAAIEKLPEGYRTVLLLRDIEEKTTEEVADLLELTPANVKTRLHRARQALRELLDRTYGEATP